MCMLNVLKAHPTKSQQHHCKKNNNRDIILLLPSPLSLSLSPTPFTSGEVVMSSNKAVQMSPMQLHCVSKRLTLPMASSGEPTILLLYALLGLICIGYITR